MPALNAHICAQARYVIQGKYCAMQAKATSSAGKVLTSNELFKCFKTLLVSQQSLLMGLDLLFVEFYFLLEALPHLLNLLCFL